MVRGLDEVSGFRVLGLKVLEASQGELDDLQLSIPTQPFLALQRCPAGLPCGAESLC